MTTQLIAFELTMPSRGSWDGKWSGESSRWIKIERVGKRKIEELLSAKSWYYHWSDGWCAKISATQVDSTEARKLRKCSRGFAGYDWMVDSIMRCNEIRA